MGHIQYRPLRPDAASREMHDFLGAQDDRELARLMKKGGVLHDVGAPKRDLEREQQYRGALATAGTPGPIWRQMKLLAVYAFEARYRVSVEEGDDVLDPLHAVMSGIRRQLTYGSSCFRSGAAAAGLWPCRS